MCTNEPIQRKGKRQHCTLMLLTYKHETIFCNFEIRSQQLTGSEWIPTMMYSPASCRTFSRKSRCPMSVFVINETKPTNWQHYTILNSRISRICKAPLQKIYSDSHTYSVGRGGTLVESIPFYWRIGGSNPALAATYVLWASQSLPVACGASA